MYRSAAITAARVCFRRSSIAKEVGNGRQTMITQRMALDIARRYFLLPNESFRHAVSSISDTAESWKGKKDERTFLDCSIRHRSWISVRVGRRDPKLFLYTLELELAQSERSV